MYEQAVECRPRRRFERHVQVHAAASLFQVASQRDEWVVREGPINYMREDVACRWKQDF
jgi:hypothetical protein